MYFTLLHMIILKEKNIFLCVKSEAAMNPNLS